MTAVQLHDAETINNRIITLDFKTASEEQISTILRDEEQLFIEFPAMLLCVTSSEEGKFAISIVNKTPENSQHYAERMVDNIYQTASSFAIHAMREGVEGKDYDKGGRAEQLAFEERLNHLSAAEVMDCIEGLKYLRQNDLQFYQKESESLQKFEQERAEAATKKLLENAAAPQAERPFKSIMPPEKSARRGLRALLSGEEKPNTQDISLG